MKSARLSTACVAVATGFYLSYIPVRLMDALRGRRNVRLPTQWTGAGWVGTMEGWASLYLLPQSTWLFISIMSLGILAACWVSTIAERELGRKDDSRIIIDEVVGFWVAAALFPRRFGLLAAAFLLFRFFDSMKLAPYRWLERLPGGWGVVLDDVGAGIAANLALRAVLQSGIRL